MSKMKDYATQVSEEMGMEGELTPKVLKEAQRRLHAGFYILPEKRPPKGEVDTTSNKEEDDQR